MNKILLFNYIGKMLDRKYVAWSREGYKERNLSAHLPQQDMNKQSPDSI